MAGTSWTDCRVAIGAVIASNGIAAVAYGLLQPVLTIRMERAGHSALVIGVVASAWALGIVAGSPFYARIIRRFGTRPSLVLGLLAAGVLMLLFTTTGHVAVWALLQCVQGLAFGHFWVLSESLINTLVDPKARGRVAALYVTVLGLGAALGPLLMNSVGTTGALPFVLCAALLWMGSAPLLLVRLPALTSQESASPRFRSIVSAFPGLIAIGLAAGFADHGPQGLLPPFALTMGATVHAVSLMLFALACGRALFVLPIGMLADRHPVDWVLAGCAAGTALLVGGIYLLWSHAAIVLALWFALGALLDAFYALGMALIGHRVQTQDLASANTAFVVLHSLGGFAGAALLGGAMDGWGPIGYPVVVAAVSLALTVLVWPRRVGGDADLTHMPMGD